MIHKKPNRQARPGRLTLAEKLFQGLKEKGERIGIQKISLEDPINVPRNGGTKIRIEQRVGITRTGGWISIIVMDRKHDRKISILTHNPETTIRAFRELVGLHVRLIN